jgi:hypothetical protein
VLWQAWPLAEPFHQHQTGVCVSGLNGQQRFLIGRYGTRCAGQAGKHKLPQAESLKQEAGCALAGSNKIDPTTAQAEPLLTSALVLFLLLGTGILCGAAVQAYHNCQRFPPGLYGTELLLFDRVSAAKNTYTFTTAELPDKAGIDPFFLLVDRVPSDNVRTVTVN